MKYPYSFFTYETTDIPIKLKDKSVLDDCQQIVVSIKQETSNTQVDIAESQMVVDVENGEIIAHLTQEDTGQFVDGVAELQINVLYSDNQRDTSEKAMIRVLDNLYKKVML